jgi:hypothetical protein
MQLSLRTLLAFEDNIFDIEQHRQLERTIPNHEPAAQTLARIRNVIHNPKINVPGRNEQQEEELDPNIVAEYLDHQMTKEYQEQFENFCLSADKYLAEVASVHQIISNVLGEPARISRECRFRCYDLLPKFQHLNANYENENQFITFPQLLSGIPTAQITPQVIPIYPPQQTTNNYDENSTKNSHNKKNLIPLPQNIDPDKKNNNEKNTGGSLRKSLRDTVSVVALIIVIVLLFLNYRNNNFNNIKNNFAELPPQNYTENPEQQIQNNSNETKLDTNQPPIDNLTSTQPATTNEHEQNTIRTVSTTNNESNTEIIPPTNENQNKTLIETKIAQQPSIINKSDTASVQPLPLPISDTNNPNATSNESQFDPFTTLPPSPTILRSANSAPTIAKETPFLADSIFNTATPSASATVPASTPTTSSTTSTTMRQFSTDTSENLEETPDIQPLPNKKTTNTNEAEIKFHEQQPDSQPISSNIWKTQIQNSDNTSETAVVTNEFDAKNYRNNKSVILPAGGINHFANTQIVQANHNYDHNIMEQVVKPNRNSTIKSKDVLGTVIETNDPMVVFTADSSESQWRFKSNQFDIYANQYILTSAPFRADIRLGEDFVIEMIGDSKLSVLPPSDRITTIYVDYGRLVIRACYDKATTIQQVKLIKIVTEQGECIIGFNGTKSVMFVDTFAEISRSPIQSDLNSNNNTTAAEIQIGTNPILGLLPDPSESISWLSTKQSVQSVTKSDMSIILSEGRTERGIIRNHPNWLRRISVPAEGKQIESACMNIFYRNNIKLESALHILLQEKSDTIRSFGYRLWGDLGRFDVPLKGRIFETESIQQSLIQYFKEVMKRDGESIQRLTDAIEKERIKNN